MKRLFIVCEGKSEEKYINALRAFLINNGVYNFTIIPYSFNGGRIYSGYLNNIKRAIKRIKEDERNLNENIYIWIDKDMFVNKWNIENFKRDIKKIENKIPVNIKILFNTMNFEDFLILHYPQENVKILQKKLIKREHFKTPLISVDYLKLYREVIPNYNKGNLPNDFKLNSNTLEQFIENMKNKTFKIKSEMKEIISLIKKKIGENES